MKHIALALALLVAPVTCSASMLSPHTDLLVFGDSLSDAGRALGALVPDDPLRAIYPSLQFTDGDTWATMLGAGDPLVNNFAFGGAKATPDGDAVPDFTAQRADFVAAREAGQTTITPQTVTAVFFGGNDVRDAIGAADPAAIVGQAIFDIVQGTSELIGLGLTDVVVFGLPNLGRIPEVLAGGDAAIMAATQASLAFNAALHGGVATLAAQTGPLGATVRYFDTFGTFEAIFERAALRGDNVTLPCLVTGLACSRSAFYDDIHPTSAVHAAFARAVAAELAPIPLPAGAVLVMTGLGGMILARRRAVPARHERRA